MRRIKDILSISNNNNNNNSNSNRNISGTNNNSNTSHHNPFMLNTRGRAVMFGASPSSMTPTATTTTGNNNTSTGAVADNLTEHMLDVEEAETTTFHNVMMNQNRSHQQQQHRSSSSSSTTNRDDHRRSQNSMSYSLSADRVYQSLLRNEHDIDTDDSDDDNDDDNNNNTYVELDHSQAKDRNVGTLLQQQPTLHTATTTTTTTSNTASSRFRLAATTIQMMRQQQLLHNRIMNPVKKYNPTTTTTSTTTSTTTAGATPMTDVNHLHYYQQQQHMYNDEGAPLIPNSNTTSKGDQLLLANNFTASYTADSTTDGSSSTNEYGSMLHNTIRRNNVLFRNRSNIVWTNYIWNCFYHYCCNWSKILLNIRYAIFHSMIIWIAIPMTLLSYLFYYHFNDMELDFLPGQISLSWWTGNFITRQMITFDLARILQYIFLADGGKHGFMGTVRKLFGFAGMIHQLGIHAKGWPAILIFWSFLDLLFLHGDNNYAKQWFAWTGFRIYRYDASYNGNNLLASELYLRLLLSMLVAGIATSVKRFLMEYQMKERQCMTYKSRLEKLLLELIVITDIANLSVQIPTIQSMMLKGDSVITDDSDKSKINELQSPPFSGTPNISEHIISELSIIDDTLYDEDGKDDVLASDNMAVTATPPKEPMLLTQTSSMNVSELLIKDLLDPWEPPENKANRNNASFRQVLRFQRALNFINADDPFGEAYGPTTDRDCNIKSAMKLYNKLLPLNLPDDKVLDFDVLLLAIYNDTGIPDPVKKKVLIRLFRPDANHNVTQLAFVQSCDAVYKRLKYFQASVGNASVLDNVLTSIVDSIFYFILVLLLLSMLQFNPWTLLVSMTSLLVSISFALGSSVSKYVEGLQLIAVVRPFDLGDRIYIGQPDTTAAYTPPGGTIDMSNCTWFVEDITVSTTTIRNARTNEVSTINNWAIAGSKIINCNRSPNALVVFNTTLHVSIFQNNNLDIFQAELQDYVATHPRIWDSLLFCRHDSIDADNEQVAFQISFRHRNSWQDAGRIKLHRAELVRFIYELSVKLQVHFETPPPRQLIYNGGALQQGQVQDFKRNLLTGDNIRNVNRNRSMSVDDDSLNIINPPIQMSKVHSTSDPVLNKD